MDLQEKVIQFHDSGANCSQSVFSTFANRLGISPQQALKIAAGFGGGMGRNGEVCGAVTGALMVLGLTYGAAYPADKEAKELAYQKTHEFMDEFRKRNKEIHCAGLLGMDVSTPEGWQNARDADRFSVVCPAVMKSSVAILKEMLDLK